MLGFVMVASSLVRHPGSIGRVKPGQALAKPNLAPVSFGQQSRDVFRDKVDHAALECGTGCEASRLAHGALGPLGAATAQFGEAADVGGGIVHGLVVARVGRGLLPAFPGRIPIIRSRCPGRRLAADLDRGRGTHVSTRCHHGEVAGVQDEGTGTGSTRSIWTDKSRDRNGRCQDLADDIAHGRIEPARRVHAQNDECSVSPRCHLDAPAHIVCDRWADRAIQLKDDCLALRPGLSLSGGRDGADEHSRQKDEVCPGKMQNAASGHQQRAGPPRFARLRFRQFRQGEGACFRHGGGNLRLAFDGENILTLTDFSRADFTAGDVLL
jgi:hypothetical protein